MGAVAFGQQHAADGAIDHLRTRTSDHRCRARQDRDLARALDHRNREVPDHLVRAAGRMHAIGEQIAVRRARIDQRGRVAGQRLRGDLRLAGGPSDVGDAVRARVGDHFLQEVEGVQRDHVQASGGEAAEQRAVVAVGQCGALRHRHCAAGARGRGQAEVGNGRHQDVLRASLGEGADQADLRGDRTADDGLRLRGIGLHREQVVGAAPDGVEGVRIDGVAGAQVTRVLAGQRRRVAERPHAVGAGARTAHGPVVAAWAEGRGCAGRLPRDIRVAVVIVGQVLRPDVTGIGGELARDVLHAGRQQRAEEAAIGQAVAEEDGLGERRIGGAGEGRCGGKRDRGGQQGPAEGGFHGESSVDRVGCAGVPANGRRRRHTTANGG